MLASGEYAGSQDLYQDSGALTTAWHDLYQVSVGYMIGLDHHKDSVGYHATSQGLCQVTLGGLLDQASQGAIYQAGHDGGDYLAARAALYLSSIGKPGTVTQGPNQAISGEMEIESQYVFNQAGLKVGEYPAEAAHYQASDGEPDAAAGLYHAGGQGMPASVGHDIPSQDLYQDSSGTKVDICKLDISDQVGLIVVEENAVSGHAVQGLVPGHAVQGLVAGHAVQGLVPGHAVQGLLAAYAVQGFVPCHAVQRLVPGHGVQELEPGHAVQGLVAAYAVQGFVPCHAVQRLVPGHGVQELEPGHAVQGLVPGHVIPVGTAPSHAASIVSEKEPALTAHSVKSINMKEVARNLSIEQISSEGKQIIIKEMVYKIIINKEKDKVPLPVNNEKEKMRAAQLQQIWKCFSERQLLLALARSNFSESQWLSNVTEYTSSQVSSKCLNDTSRALKVKLVAATLLATGDLIRSWSCVLTSHPKSDKVISFQSC